MKRLIGAALILAAVCCGLGWGVERLGNVSAMSADASQRAVETVGPEPSSWLLWCGGALLVLGLGLVLAPQSAQPKPEERT